MKGMRRTWEPVVLRVVRNVLCAGFVVYFLRTQL